MTRDNIYAEKLSRMIQCETISVSGVRNQEKFTAFHSVLESLFPSVFRTMERMEFGDALLLKWKAKNPKGEPVLLMSHQDVVEATGEWKHPPFSGDIADGAVWGRGTVDTKGSLFCIFQAFEELIDEGYKPDVDLYIASGADEETDKTGAKATAEYLKANGIHLQMLMDEGGMIIEEPMKGAEGRFAMIGCLEKGTGNYRFVAHDKGGHSSAPGKNTALPRLGAFMAEIEKKNPFTAKMNDTTKEMFKRLGPHIKGPLGFVMKHAGFFSPLLEKAIPMVNHTAGAMIRTTLAFTMAKGSDGMNVLPEKAYVIGNLRFIHHQGPEESRRILEKIAAKHGVEIEVITEHEGYPVVDFRKAPYRLVEETVKEIYPDAIPTPYAMTGNTDAAEYSIVTENAIRFAPLYINQQQYKSIHASNENISVDALPKGVDFYKSILKKIKGTI